MSFRWSKDTYEQSLSSRCWWFTPYDGGQWSDTICADDELRRIVEMEATLGDVPPWAQQIVRDRFKGHGTGHALVAAAEEEARRQGRKGIVVTAFYHDFWFMPAPFFSGLIRVPRSRVPDPDRGDRLQARKVD